MVTMISPRARKWSPWWPERFGFLDISQMTAIQAYRAIKNTPGSFVLGVGILPFSARNWLIYRAVRGRKTAALALGGIPRGGAGYFPIPWRFFGVTPVTHVFGAGWELNLRCYPIGRDTEVVPVHSLDYETSRGYRRNMYRGMVYLDSGIGQNPGDVSIGDWKAHYAELDRVLPKKCHICLHPKTDYPSGLFGNRSRSVGDTVQRVASSHLVYNSISTSISFAHIFDKLVVSVITEEMKKNRVWHDLACEMRDIPREEYLWRFVRGPRAREGSLWDTIEEVMG